VLIGNLRDQFCKGVCGSPILDAIRENKMKVAIYTRVSTTKQNIKQQQDALIEYCGHKGYHIWGVYFDKAVSGSTISRGGLDCMMREGRLGYFDAIVVYDVDRIGRNWELGVLFEKFLVDSGLQLISMRDNLEMETANGRLNYRIKCVVAAFEREATIEKIKLGVQRAKKEGKYKGRKLGSKNKRPIGRPKGKTRRQLSNRVKKHTPERCRG